MSQKFVCIAAILFVSLGSYGSARITVPPEALASFERALEFERRGEMDRALEHFWAAHSSAPTVMALDDHGMLDRIMASLERSVNQEPQEAQHRFRLAELQGVRGRWDDALANYSYVHNDLNAPEALRVRSVERLTDIRDRRDVVIQAREAYRPPSPDPRITRLEGDNEYLAGLLDEVRTKKRELRRMLWDKERELEQARTEAQSARDEVEAIRESTRDWRLYYHLYWANPANYQTARPGSGSPVQ